MYARQHTQEPGSAFYGAWGTAPGDPGSTKNDRRVHFIALNNIFIPNNTTTVAVRYGYNRFVDNGSFYPGVRRRNARPAVQLCGLDGLQYLPESHRERLRRDVSGR